MAGQHNGPVSLRRHEHLPAGRRQIGQLDRRLWRRGRLGLGVQHGVCEPPVKLFSAAVVWRWRRLVVTVGIASGTMNTDVEVIVVMPPWAIDSAESAIKVAEASLMPNLSLQGTASSA